MQERLSGRQRDERLATLVALLAGLTDLVRPARTSSAAMERMIAAYAENLVDLEPDAVEAAIAEWPRTHGTWPTLAELREAAGAAPSPARTKGDPVIARKMAELCDRGWNAVRLAAMPRDASVWLAAHIRKLTTDALVESLARAEAAGITPPPHVPPRSATRIDGHESILLAVDIARQPATYMAPVMLLDVYFRMCAASLTPERLVAVQREVLAAAAPEMVPVVERLVGFGDHT